MKIVVAMSGGVDSSIAAALLKEQGHEVVGATMQLRPQADTDDRAVDTSVQDARQAADRLGIRHYIFDFRDIFANTVITYFCQEYNTGRTPNPCILCNRYIKFGLFWEKVRELGADFMATGHYATIELTGGRYMLKKGADPKKDQSYFLYRLTQEQLERTLFPLSNLTKDKVKQIAREMALPAIARPESQEICFIPDNDYAGFLEKNYSVNARPGPILDGTGKKLGEHQGIYNYTIGQRKGLGITAEEPLYVTHIDAGSNTIYVGAKEQTYADELTATSLNWIAISPPDKPLKVKARVRYRHQEAEAAISPAGENEVSVKFTVPQMSVTPGQSVVFYDGETVLGGGIILRQGR